ncbi:hypothetical protein C2845_PM17G02680 [Panicum miliaceum]|uniref:Uncharacterized protein n=1 Tax=Panicum miliaceum TaxID=4540 RepID=A0A3L6Q2T0_PANMI|nr:hypothetical protein C2845_PM17G02680 [Panicum miliaceum]
MAPAVMEIGTVDSFFDAGAKDGDFTAAAAADLKERSTSSLWVSVPYAVITSLALWPVADRPRSVVWVFSIITSAFLVLWTVILTRTMRARTVFFSVSYVALIAAAIAHSRTGMAIMHLDTAYAAGLFGYALAEHSPHAKRSAAAVPMPSSSSPSEEELKQQDNCTYLATFVAAVISLLCAGCAAFVLCYTRDTYWLIMEVSFLVDLSIFCWMCTLTLQILHGVFIEVDHMTTTYLIGPASLILLEISVSYFFGKAIGTLVYSLGMIVMAGLFGYSIGIYAHYKNLVALEMSTEASKLALNQDSTETLTKTRGLKCPAEGLGEDTFNFAIKMLGSRSEE